MAYTQAKHTKRCVQILGANAEQVGYLPIVYGTPHNRGVGKKILKKSIFPPIFSKYFAQIKIFKNKYTMWFFLVAKSAKSLVLDTSDLLKQNTFEKFQKTTIFYSCHSEYVLVFARWRASIFIFENQVDFIRKHFWVN